MSEKSESAPASVPATESQASLWALQSAETQAELVFETQPETQLETQPELPAERQIEVKAETTPATHIGLYPERRKEPRFETQAGTLLEAQFEREAETPAETKIEALTGMPRVVHVDAPTGTDPLLEARPEPHIKNQATSSAETPEDLLIKKSVETQIETQIDTPAEAPLEARPAIHAEAKTETPEAKAPTQTEAHSEAGPVTYPEIQAETQLATQRPVPVPVPLPVEDQVETPKVTSTVAPVISPAAKQPETQPVPQSVLLNERPFRVKLRGSVLVLIKLPNKRQLRAALHQLSITGGVINLEKPLDEKIEVELIFHIDRSTIRGKAQMLFPMWATQGWMQPFRFLELSDADREALKDNLQAFVGMAKGASSNG